MDSLIPRISSIRIYPIKSLDPVELNAAEIGIHSLKYDRAYALVDENGGIINGKRTGKVNKLHSEYDLKKGIVRLSRRGQSSFEEFELSPNNKFLSQFFSDFFEMKISVINANDGSLLDVPIRSSITVVSLETYKMLLEELGENDLETIRRRFRSNIEIEGLPAFWEENVFGLPSSDHHFKIGDVEMRGIFPRKRCNVPPRDPFNGELDKTFVSKFMRARVNGGNSHLIAAHHREFYQLTMDVYIDKNQKGKRIEIGDLYST